MQRWEIICLLTTTWKAHGIEDRDDEGFDDEGAEDLHPEIDFVESTIFVDNGLDSVWIVIGGCKIRIKGVGVQGST